VDIALILRVGCHMKVAWSKWHFSAFSHCVFGTFRDKAKNYYIAFPNPNNSWPL